MTEDTSSHIQQLMEDYGLFNLNEKKTKTFVNYNFSQEIILITGAAGSIGSGLVKQLLHASFKKMILVDNAETSLYFLIKELDIPEHNNIDSLILDIREKESMKWLFKTYKPTLIFHAAAYKHVSLTEENPYEAIKLNIFATKLLADLAIEYKTKSFIFISTDKAVHPISVMGMTKFIAELYLDTLRFQKNISFITIRFGNVFGSNGSVVPLFLKQIERKEPLTVTNSEATRYFIDNHKACNLVLKVASMPKLEGNNITFFMGEPIRIIDLANALMKLYDYKNKVILTNLKNGERLHETFIAENETLKSTTDKDIFVILKNEKKHNGTIDLTPLYKLTLGQKASEIKDILISYI